MTPESVFLSLATAMALAGLVLFWHRPSRSWWLALTTAATAVTLLALVGVPPLPVAM